MKRRNKEAVVRALRQAQGPNFDLRLLTFDFRRRDATLIKLNRFCWANLSNNVRGE